VLGSRKPFGEISGEEPDEAPGPERRVEAEQLSEAIEEALMSIKPDLRTVIVLRHSLNLSYQDMSDVLQLPAKTVKSRLYDARQLVRDHLLQRGIL
jgi:RNA polymerase sigma-70 factor (ECF subfamily)